MSWRGLSLIEKSDALSPRATRSFASDIAVDEVFGRFGVSHLLIPVTTEGEIQNNAAPDESEDRWRGVGAVHAGGSLAGVNQSLIY